MAPRRREPARRLPRPGLGTGSWPAERSAFLTSARPPVDGHLATTTDCALVTGASSGIGAAFARALRTRGRRLFLVARRREHLRRLADELGGETLVGYLALDLTEEGAAAAVEAELRSRSLAVDLLVNNAGVGHTGPFHEAPRERVLDIVDLNVRSVVELTRAFLPGMVERRRGAIVNVVSMSAFQAVPFLAAYAASKAFLLSFTESVAAEVAPSGVRVQALCPGLVRTGFQEVAGTDRVRFDRTPSTPAEVVVAASLDALEKGPVRVVPGWRDRLSLAAQRVVPRGLVVRVASELFRPANDRKP